MQREKREDHDLQGILPEGKHIAGQAHEDAASQAGGWGGSDGMVTGRVFVSSFNWHLATK